MASLSGAWNDLKGLFSGIGNTLEGDPAAAAAGLSQLQQQAYAQGNNIKDFLMGQKANSEAYYKPMQQMFGSLYGTGGIKAPVAPKAPGGGSPYGY